MVKKSNQSRKIRVSKKGTASQAIGIIEKNTDTFILTYGQFSLIDALMAILDQTGPAHVTVCTWTAAHSDLTRSAELLETAEILSFRMIVDGSFHSRQPEYYNHMIKLFGDDSIRTIGTHAKFLIIKNDRWDIVVRTSMNLNNNPRLEDLEISDNAEFAKFFYQIADDIFLEVAPGNDKKQTQPPLNSIIDNDSFTAITANAIKRKTLKEASYTHEIKH